ncbi:macro domain-like protein [Panus rudis PR-1116 ss-1]|nr:macro domain-like protein [Panus rudis PR-1116 ss-1]
MDQLLHTQRPPREIPEPDASVLPSFVLIAPSPYTSPRTKKTAPSLCEAWRAALANLHPAVAGRFTVKEARFDAAALAEEFGTFDCIVSPANAFGIMDGGYDLALSRAFIVDGDIWALTNAVQDVLFKKHRGYLPPGCCTMVPLSPTLTASNPLGCTSLAVVPTMRTPEDVSWHRDLVYECMWNLLVALWRWNEGERPEAAPRIQQVLLTGLGTGNGGIDLDKCAKQMFLAALNFARGWGEHPRWDDVLKRAQEMDSTRDI